jgi:hypothetical protein
MFTEFDTGDFYSNLSTHSSFGEDRTKTTDTLHEDDWVGNPKRGVPVIQKGQRSISGERAAIVSVCVHFLICFIYCVGYLMEK